MLTSPVTFGPFTLDPAQRHLRRDDVPIRLAPKAMDLLLVLVESAGAMVTKDQLMARVWPDTFVEEGNLPVTVFALRKALGDAQEQYIRTVPKHGYCFVAPVVAVAVESRTPSNPTVPSSPELTSAEPQLPIAAATHQLSPTPQQPSGSASDSNASMPHRRRSASWVWGAVALAAGLVAAVVMWQRTPSLASVNEPPIRSLAVLPFSVVDGTTADTPLGAGLAADIVERLSAIETVRVRPLASTIKFTTRDALKASDAVKTDGVLTGTMRMTATGVELQAELLRRPGGAKVWSMPADTRTLTLEDAGGYLAARLAPVLGETGHARPVSFGAAHTHSADAYRLYIEGLALASQMTAPEMVDAIARFERAVSMDDAFVDAHAALARFSLLPIASAPTPARFERARSAATRALALDPQRPTARASLATVRIFADGRWNDGLEEGRRAIAQAPNDAELRLWHAIALGARGNLDDALAEIDRGIDLDPTSPRLHLYRGLLLTMARRYDEAIAQFRQTPLEIGVVNQQIYFGIGLANAKKTRYDLAESAIDRVLGRTHSQQALAHLAYVDAESGDSQRARALLREALEAKPGLSVPHTVIAAAQACVGQTDEAFASLARAREGGDVRVIFAKVDPILDCARTDPRFPAFVRSLGLTIP